MEIHYPYLFLKKRARLKNTLYNSKAIERAKKKLKNRSPTGMILQDALGNGGVRFYVSFDK